MANKPTGILLHSGQLYDYLSPETNVWDIEDVALGLSNICRFGGQVSPQYSVAQHSIIVSHVVNPKYALAGLLHDAAEAFLGDIPTPLKMLLPDYKELEHKHEAEIFKRFGLEYPMNPAVKEADLAVLKAEVFYLKKCSEHWGFLKNVKTIPEVIVPVSSEAARKGFIHRYYELTSKTRKAA